MCIDSIAIARRTYVKHTDVPAASNVTFPANPDRIGVIVGVGGTADYNTLVYLTDRGAGANASLTISRGSGVTTPSMVTLTVAEHGAAVMNEFSVSHIPTVAGPVCTVTEIIMQPELSAAVNHRLNSLQSRR